MQPTWCTATAIVKVQNEKLAELCASRPDRFAAFASLALQYPDLAVEQLERGAAIERAKQDREAGALKAPRPAAANDGSGVVSTGVEQRLSA